MVDIPEPYIPSFLAMREARPLVALVNAYKASHPEKQPQVLLVDGNGRLHERQAGLAVSIGVDTNTPCIGIAKEYYPVPTTEHCGSASAFRSGQKEFKNVARQLLHRQGDYILVPDPTGQQVIGAVRASPKLSLSTNRSTPAEKVQHGQAVYTSPRANASQAVYVSSGHRVGLTTAMRLACACVDGGRLPVPVRVADTLSREAVKKQEKHEAARPDEVK